MHLRLFYTTYNKASWVKTWFISRALIVFKNRYIKKFLKMLMFITIEMDSVPGLRQYLLHFVVVVVAYCKRP